MAHNFYESLKNFVHLVERRDDQIKRAEEDYYAWEFLKIRIESEDLRSLPEFSCSIGSRPENSRKNRYRDILPFDSSRVKITPYADDIDSDYINASLINGANGTVAYIAAQGPMPETVGDFWQMVAEYDVKTILMLCDLFEGGKSKCHQYWPDFGTTVEYSHSTIANTFESQPQEHFTVRHLTLTCYGRVSHLKQFHYHGWPDHGTPDDIEPLLDFVETVRQWQNENDLEPILVHCSAGCGRSGTFCALDIVRTQLKNKKIPVDFNICALVGDLRKQRLAMVQSKDQYVLLHRAVSQLFSHYLETEGKLINGSSDIEDNRSLEICPSSSSTSVFLNCCDEACSAAPIRPPRTRKAMRNRIIHSDSCSSMLLSEDQISLTKNPSSSSVFTHNSSAKSSPERSPIENNLDADVLNKNRSESDFVNCINIPFAENVDKTLTVDENNSKDSCDVQKFDDLLAPGSLSRPVFRHSLSLPSLNEKEVLRKISTMNGVMLKKTYSVDK